MLQFHIFNGIRFFLFCSLFLYTEHDNIEWCIYMNRVNIEHPNTDNIPKFHLRRQKKGKQKKEINFNNITEIRIYRNWIKNRKIEYHFINISGKSFVHCKNNGKITCMNRNSFDEIGFNSLPI